MSIKWGHNHQQMGISQANNAGLPLPNWEAHLIPTCQDPLRSSLADVLCFNSQERLGTPMGTPISSHYNIYIYYIIHIIYTLYMIYDILYIKHYIYNL